MSEPQPRDKSSSNGRPQQRPTIGLLIESFWDGYQGTIWRGVVDLAHERGVNLICFNGGRLGYATANDLDVQRNILYDLATADTVDGLIVVGSSVLGRARPEVLKSFCQRYRPLPIVNIGFPLEGVPRVLVDVTIGLRDEIKHLIEVHGYRRIGFIRGPENHKEAEQRYGVYKQVLAECGLPLDPELVAQGSFAPATGTAAMRAWLDQHVDIEAVVAANDHMALGALEELQARGVRVPDEVAVAGFDDWSVAVKLIQRLTTVRQPIYKLGYSAAELVLKLIAGEAVPEQVALPTELVVRRSCGCQSAATAQAMTGAVEPNHQELEAYVAQQRADIVAEIAQVPGLTTEGAEQLLNCFAFEMKGEVSGIFLHQIDDLIGQAVVAGSDVAAWQNALSILRKYLQPVLVDKAAMLARADDLWQQARVAISEGTQRVQAYQEVQVEQQARTLREIDQALITTFDVQGLMDILAKELPRLGIPSAYLALYEDPQAPTAWSRLVLGYHEQGQMTLEPGGSHFSTPQLVPANLWPQGRPYNYVAEPLYFRGDQIGFALFETGPLDGSVYEALRGGISNALQGATLVKHVQERSAELERQQYILDAFMENVPDSIYFKDLASRFTRMNKALARHFELSDPAEGVGKSDFDFFPEEQARPKFEQEREIIHTGQPILNLEEPDGIGHWSLTTKMPLRDENSTIIGTFGISRDITERKQAEAALRYRLKLEEILSTISTIFINLALADTDNAINDVLKVIGTFAGVDRSYVFLLSSDGVYINNTHEWCAEGITPEIENLQGLIANVPSWWMDRLRKLETIHIPHLDDLPPEASGLKETLQKQGIRSLIAVPIAYRKGLVGYLGFDSVRAERPWPDEDIGLLKMVSEILASALERKRVEVERQQWMADLERRTQQLQTAAKVSSVTSSILSPEELMQQTVDLMCERFGMYYTGLFLVDQTGEWTGEANRWAVLRAGTGEAGQKMLASGHKLELDEASMIGWCILNQKARIALDTGDEAVRFNNPLLPETRSELALPLISRGQAIGAMTVQSEWKAAFTQEDVTVLQTMADQLANAIANTQLFEQTQQRTIELSNAREVAETAQREAEKARREAEAEKEMAEAAKEEAEKARRDTEAANRNLAAQMWQTTGQAQLNDRMRGEQDITTLANNVIDQLCEYIGAQMGTLYVLEAETLKLMGTCAYRRRNLTNEFKVGEGTVGQVVLRKRMNITALPDHYLNSIFSSTGELLPQHVLTAPFAYEGQVIGVVEIESMAEFTAAQLEFLNKALETIAVGFTTAQARRRVNELLAQTQQQAGELQMQEEELRSANEELASQAENLRASEAKLRANQAELEAANVELEEKATVLQEQQQVLDRQNQNLRQAQQELKQKAEDLALASKYKSEFLANMSHELRTPLNSLLILAGMFAKNEQGNLTPDQVESAQIIHGAGTDLLNLINDILDLSKVEAGKMEFRYAAMPPTRLVESMRIQFAPLAESKGLEFVITLADDVPPTIETDQQRVEQIIKNLLSNAFKFTPEGHVRLEVFRPTADTDLSQSGLGPDNAIAIRVVDTGIGMTPAQQKIVFEAFQQADGSTSRQYGGTGLGLSISRELALKLGGQIELESAVGQGSTFTLYLPIERSTSPSAASQAKDVARPPKRQRASQARPQATVVLPSQQAAEALPSMSALADDRATIQPGDRILLIVEDDLTFAEIVQNYGRRKNFKCLVAVDGESSLRLAQRYKPDAIILDLNLPDISGWEVLDELKHRPDTLHIPVHIITAQEESLDAFKRGAMGFLTKPIGTPQIESAFQSIEQFMAHKIKSLLVVEDDDHLRKSVRKLLEGSDVTISEANTGQSALTQLAAQHFDCMILDLTLPDMSGFELLNRLDGAEHLPKCPVIVYTGKALSEEENQELMKYADSVIVKGAKSPERLLDETALFLHRVVADMPEEKQRMIKRSLDKDGVLEGKAILIVDDDARNAFALSKLLAEKGLKVHIAPNGQKALDALDKTPLDLVLMDIMLPGLDGYAITRQIRAQLRFRQLPILALTAKAMKGDREKCLEAGANDYLAKPVDVERLLSMLRVWLSKE